MQMIIISKCRPNTIKQFFLLQVVEEELSSTSTGRNDESSSSSQLNNNIGKYHAFLCINSTT